MPITLLDGIVIGFTLVSALLAMVRGFSREVLSIASWVAAAAAAYYFHPILLPYVTPYVDHPMVSLAIAAGIIFFIALIVVTVITMKIADFIIDSKVGALDRTLGFIYGAGRGLLVLAVALLFFNWLVGTNPPAWVTEAKSRPMLESIGAWLQGILPDDPENSILNRLRGEDGDEAQPAPDAPAQPAQPGQPAQPPVNEDDLPAEDEAPAEE
ncbi:MAG: CvpA family protein [Rhizobiaceae bacterium]|nr:CvpA family protein [Rhizobiaceae bacterium]